MTASRSSSLLDRLWPIGRSERQAEAPGRDREGLESPRRRSPVRSSKHPAVPHPVVAVAASFCPAHRLLHFSYRIASFRNASKHFAQHHRHGPRSCHDPGTLRPLMEPSCTRGAKTERRLDGGVGGAPDAPDDPRSWTVRSPSPIRRYLCSSPSQPNALLRAFFVSWSYSLA